MLLRRSRTFHLNPLQWKKRNGPDGHIDQQQWAMHRHTPQATTRRLNKILQLFLRTPILKPL
jgi:hypothetical protein